MYYFRSDFRERAVIKRAPNDPNAVTPVTDLNLTLPGLNFYSNLRETFEGKGKNKHSCNQEHDKLAEINESASKL